MRYFISPDVDLDSFWPDDEEDFSFLLQALVGPDGADGEESLQFIVCTPRALDERVRREGVLFGRSLVIASSPDIRLILDAVKSRIERVEAPSWREIGILLARVGLYEFEDYTV